MKNYWNKSEAKRFDGDELALRVYSSRLIGKCPDLVLHGGGNTSVKTKFIDLFGESHDVLYVKGSGWDLATIEAEGFAPVRIDQLLKLADFDELSDADMVRSQRAAMLDPMAPNPSVEAILHALIPYRYVDHTHADAVVTLTNTPDGENAIKSIYGDRILIIPYVMPGFILAKTVANISKNINWEEIDGMVLMHHGIFTFSDEAKKSYDNMIDFVNLAENALGAAPKISSRIGKLTTLELSITRSEVCKILGAPFFAKFNGEPEVLQFCEGKRIREISTRGPLTPDHVIRTKRIPLIIEDDIALSIRCYAEEYQSYFKNYANEGLHILDSAPRWAIWPNKGIICFGKCQNDVKIVEDIALHTIKAIDSAERHGGWKALPETDVFDVEYWELEQAKINKTRNTPLFEGQGVLITGGANGIGYECAIEMARKGAAVTVLDKDPTVIDIFNESNIQGIECDIDDVYAVNSAIDCAVKFCGGLDVLVSNAGIFSEGAEVIDMSTNDWQRSLDINLTGAMKVIRQSIPFLKSGWNSSIVIIGSKNVAAPGPGAAAYSVAKAGLTQLARVLSLELSKYGIRVNTIHPNAVFDTSIWTDEVLESRASSYNLTVEAYKMNNLLGQEITSRDIAAMVCAMAGPVFRCTTGAQVPIDGGNDRVL